MQKRPAPNWKHALIRPHVAAGRVLVGIDEVGRGAWAGPVVAGAVILPPGLLLPGLNDSKLLTPAARRRLDRDIRRQAVAVGLGWVAAAEIDREGLSWAVRQSGLRALAALGQSFDLVILDGKHNYLAADYDSLALVKADQLVVPVAAGSVVAKVARDRYLEGLDQRYPGYGLARHKGYGTSLHAVAIDELGACEVHRRSWSKFQEVTRVND